MTYFLVFIVRFPHSELKECSLRNHRLIIAIWAVGIVLAVICVIGIGFVNYRYCQQNPGGMIF